MKNYNIKEKWVVVGEIIKTYGTKGLVKIISYCEKPHSIFDYQPIVLKSTGEKIDFGLDEEKNNFKTNQFTARIRSSKNMETSKVFIGEKLLAHKNKFQNLKKNTFFYSDLEGCNVIDLNKKSIGRVSRIFNFGAGDILEITKLEDNSTILINFNKTNFPKVFINKREIISKVSI